MQKRDLEIYPAAVLRDVQHQLQKQMNWQITEEQNIANH
jgi:hypothetical protein